jgi:hypothetical protein
VLSREVAAFIESGLAMGVATRDARLQPEVMRAMGAWVRADGAHLAVLLPDAASRRTLENLREVPRLAIALSRIHDDRTLQIKGRILSLAPAGEQERAAQARYVELLAAALGFVGVSPLDTHRLAQWPAHLALVEVEVVYEQTPGPGAGAPLGGGAK